MWKEATCNNRVSKTGLFYASSPMESPGLNPQLPFDCNSLQQTIEFVKVNGQKTRLAELQPLSHVGWALGCSAA